MDLIGAVKMTGQLGRFRYGVLGAFEDDTTLHAELNGAPYPIFQSGSDYGIARLLYEDSPNGAYRAFGVLSTAVLNRDQDALATGLDAHYLASNGKLKLDSQVFTSAKDGVDRGYGGFVDMEYTIRQGVTQRVGIEYFDKHVDINDLGYLARNDSFRIRAAHIRTNSNIKWARENQFDVRGFAQRNTEHYFTGGGVFFTDKLTFHNLTSVEARLFLNAPAYDDLNSVGNGTFRIDSRIGTAIDYSSDSTKKLSYGGGIFFGHEDLGGAHAGYGVNANFRPSDQYTFSAHLNYDDSHGWLLHDSGRDFTTFDAEQWEVRLSADYFLTAKQQLRTSLQWVGIQARQKQFYLVPLTPGDLIEVAGAPGRSDSFSIGILSFQMRYRWEIAPLSDLFVVYTRISDRARALHQSTFSDVFDDSWHSPLNDVFVVKLRYRFGS